MSSSVAALTELIASSRGRRPQSLECGEAEEVLNIALALIIELAVSNERIDRLERLLAEVRRESVETLRGTSFEDVVSEERQREIDSLILRALRVMVDPRKSDRAGAE